MVSVLTNIIEGQTDWYVAKEKAIKKVVFDATMETPDGAYKYWSRKIEAMVKFNAIFNLTRIVFNVNCEPAAIALNELSNLFLEYANNEKEKSLRGAVRASEVYIQQRSLPGMLQQEESIATHKRTIRAARDEFYAKKETGIEHHVPGYEEKIVQALEKLQAKNNRGS